MDHVEAKWLLLRTLVEYRRCSYDELRTMIGESKQTEIVGASGTQYQLDVEVVWDARPAGDIRIVASIDDGGWRAFCPLSYGGLVPPPQPSPLA
jgi:hypothetical protein